MKKNLFIFLIILFIYTNESFSLQNIIKVEINPLNRANIYFSEAPQYFKSSLSDDKKNIKVLVKNSNFDEKNSRLSSSGIIKEVFLKRVNKDVEINLFLKDKRGYTAVILPYSRSLIVEVFNWSELSPEEDLYRSALLALEDGLLYNAKQLLIKSAEKKFPNALVFLGIIYLQEGKIDSALYVLNQAEEYKANINDLWSALSQVHQIKGNNNLATKYQKIFFEKTQLKSFPQLPINSIKIEQDSNLVDSISQLFALVNRINVDTHYVDVQSDTIKRDTLTKEQSISDTLKAEEDSSFQIPLWLKDILLYGSIIIFSLIIILFVYYLKWRKLQVQRLKNLKRKTKFSDEITEAKGKISGSAFITKKYSEDEQKQKTEICETIEKDEVINRKEAILRKKQEQHEELAKKLELIAQKIIEAKKTSSESSVENVESELKKVEPKKSQLPPKVELALQLQQEQQKLKAETIQSISIDEIPDDEEKISELAKKLGVDKKILETKKKIGGIEKDEEIISKLKEKFKK